MGFPVIDKETTLQLSVSVVIFFAGLLVDFAFLSTYDGALRGPLAAQMTTAMKVVGS